MNFQFQGHKKYLSVFHFSSLTDIVLLLLIFFLLTSTYTVLRGMDVTLPAATSSQPPQRKTISIAMTKDKKLFVENKQVTKDQLADALKAVFTQDHQIVIQADKSLVLEEVVEVLDISKGIGATRLFIATESAK
ncbi:MAG: biopolymer transporter ExbD [Bacteroidota bacterium]|nr:biopolymer transporter ExbD [Bacteroidota bacterium]